MPTYNYKCEDCGHLSSVIQSIKDEPLTRCAKCGGKIYRIISGGSGLIFKGSGFYVNDYAHSSAFKSGKKIKKTETAKSPEKPAEKSEPVKSGDD